MKLKSFHSRPFILLIALITTFGFQSFGFCAPSEDTHSELIALRELATKALNERDYDTLATKVVAKEFSLTTARQQHFKTVDAFKAYYDGLFSGPEAVLKSVSLNPVANERTRFLNDQVGLVEGTSEDSYEFLNGDVKVMSSRWSATLLKEPEGWKVASLHIGADFSDNPVIDGIKKFTKLVGIGSFIVGILLGWALTKKFAS